MSKTKSTSIDKLIKEKIEATASLKKEYDKRVKTDAKEIVHMLKDLISDSDGIEAIRWSQYTPYFNDGDVCEFGVNDLEIKFDQKKFPVTKDLEEDEEEEEFVQDWQFDKFFERQEDVINFKEVAALEKKVKVFQDIHSELQNMEDGLKEAFGDHVTVTVTRKGIETESYDHE